jgi:cell division septal protein FtsQ
MGNTIDKLVKLEILWKDVVREKGAQELQYIDLRYDNQVIVRWNKENI